MLLPNPVQTTNEWLLIVYYYWFLYCLLMCVCVCCQSYNYDIIRSFRWYFDPFLLYRLDLYQKRWKQRFVVSPHVCWSNEKGIEVVATETTIFYMSIRLFGSNDDYMGSMTAIFTQIFFFPDIIIWTWFRYIVSAAIHFFPFSANWKKLISQKKLTWPEYKLFTVYRVYYT